VTQADATADEAEAQAIERGRILFAQACDFVAAAEQVERLPMPSHPEIAFAGRSNVGKSSLINALTGRRTLARTSNTPGRTRQVNFFDLGGRLMLVDLPGYGFARAPKGEIVRWTGLVEAYLSGRPNLRRVCLLIDSRHGIKPHDEGAMALLDKAAVSYQVVLTKIDELATTALAAMVAETAAKLVRRRAAHPRLIATSARSGAGIALLRAELAQFA
jgi:GTP-binding protein